MAGMVQPDEPRLAGYRGLDAIYQFTNWDGRLLRFNCGQAAACTFLSHHGRFTDVEAKASQLMRAIELAHPPDNLGGWLGTSRRRVKRICRARGLRLAEVRGEDALRGHLSQRRPAIVLLGMPGRPFLRWRLPAGHWMVAYGFDDNHVYLSNKGRMTWDVFRAGWHSLVPRLVSMHGRGLVSSQ